ncbi:MAG TPA: ABC transporter substrate-binding protein [Candidatus Eremiobacteraeota bacterium]|nr:MAG: Leucine-, isoleucine-, valine-, threonine-, and alanine-binding protein precursor [bacterium ADurb.Bin363]HPZ06692.1 ABC transporter substrate-binding protein [Candidatus Eremiobacteraeota bacterium]
MKKIFIISFILLIITSGCNQNASTPESIKIGAVYPQTGEDKIYGLLEGNAYILAAEEINKKGGINGKQIELINKDDFSSPEIAGEVTKELIEKEQVIAVVGSFASSSTLKMAEICKDLKTPLICSSGAADEITGKGNEWVFRACAPSRYYSITVIDYLLKKYPPKTIAILYEGGFFGTTACAYLKKYSAEKKINLIIEEKYTKGMLNFKPILEKIKEKNPDLLYIIAYKGDSSLLMKQARELKVNPKIFVGAGIGFTDPEFIPSAGKDAEYILIVNQWNKNANLPGSEEFVSKYKEKFNYEPDYHAAFAYAAFTVLSDSIKRAAGENRESLKKSLKETDMDTVIGRVRFEDYDGFTNQNKHKTIVMQIQKGEFIPVYPSEISKGKALLPVPLWSER